MVYKGTTSILLAAACTLLTVSSASKDKIEKFAPFCSPFIIAHRGACGYVPEHTLGAYALAIAMGADYVEPDLVMTKDKHLVARHENNLRFTTDIEDHPEFANRYRTQTIDDRTFTGWFTEDFTLAELKTLRAIERIPTTRPGNARMNKAFEIPTLQEIIDLVKNMQICHKRVIGIIPETKHPTHFQRLGLAMEQALVDILHQNGYKGTTAPIFIQSFEVNNLKQLKNMTGLNLLQLMYTNKTVQPFDQVEEGSDLTFGDMATPAGLLEVAKYASAVGPEKGYIIPRDKHGKLGEATSFVVDAHKVGLRVFPWTFRAENKYLPAEFRSVEPSPHETGNFSAELQAFVGTGIDGLFSDHPDVPLRLRDLKLYPIPTTNRLCDCH